MVPNSADYRLMSKRAVETLLQFKERNLFLRGMVPMVGFPSAKVYYARKERFAGESKYPLKKMIKFALDGITSFSTAPINVNYGLRDWCCLCWNYFTDLYISSTLIRSCCCRMVINDDFTLGSWRCSVDLYQYDW